MSDLFGRARFLGTPPRGLALETSKRNPIENEVGLEPVPSGQVKQFYDMVTENGWIERRSPTGVYNCAGHVWATRRTGIHEPSVWEMILRDDGYRVLGESEPPRPGDLAIYRLVDGA